MGMPPNMSGWWTDEKVDATVTSQYVHSHLRPSEAEQLTKSVFGDLSDDTYLEWILTRSKRFFLTLVEAGVPDQIFGIIDDSWDDEDLPIPEHEVPGLLLSAEPDKALDQRFYRAQFKYLIRVVDDGEHIRYAQEETVPVTPLSVKSMLGRSKEGMEKVKLPSDNRRVFVRRRIPLRNRHMEEELLAEMADWRSFAHEHILSIFGSYTIEDHLHVLMTPAPESTLKSFLNDTPKTFDALPKPERRRIILQWSHCLASGVSWLHTNGKHHGAIRPSRVHIDDQYRIFLGQFDGTGILCDSAVKDDIEAYQYAAPERWKRSVTVQATGNARTVLPSGGRTGRRLTTEADRSMSRAEVDSSHSTGSHKLNLARPTSVSYVFSPTSKTGSRLRLGSTKNAVARMGSVLRHTESRQTTHVTDGRRPTRTSLETHARPGASPVLSSSSSEHARSRHQTGPIYAATPEMRTAVVQTWVSAQHDQLAADIFSLGAIMMDLITSLCKHSFTSFARHRSSKNKSAGRGGGLADASFHANVGQVFTWSEMLQKDAEKKIKKDDGKIFKAVGPCLQVVLQCLEREPMDRLQAVELQKKLCDHIRDFAGLNTPHCCLKNEIDGFQDRPQSRAASVNLMSQMPGPRQQMHRHDSSSKPKGEARLLPKNMGSATLPRIESLKISPSGFSSFDFDINNLTNTLIGSDSQARDKSRERPDSFAFATGDGVEVFPRPPTAASTTTSRRRYPRAEAGDSNGAASTVPRVNFHHHHQQPLSAAASTVGAATEDFQSVYSYTPPPTAHPTRDLPPIPRSTTHKPSNTTNLSPTTAPTRTTVHPARSTSRAASQLSPMQASDNEPTALPALPTIDNTTMHNLRSNSNTRTQHQSQPSNLSPNPRRTPSRADNVTETAEITSPSNPEPTSHHRQYRSSSRAGMNENRLYVSHLGRDKLALRGLHYP